MRGYISQLIDIGTGDGSIVATGKIIRRVIITCSKNPTLRHIAIKIVSPVKPRDYLGEAEALFYYVRNNIRFVRDIKNVETVQTPLVTLLKLKSGDCDDMVAALGCLLYSIGHSISLVIIASRSQVFDHIYLSVKINGRWIPMDASSKNYPFGWRYPNPIRRMIMGV